jgi:hypothetical protein
MPPRPRRKNVSESSIEIFTKGRLTKAKASELTQAIRRQSVGLWLLVKVAHDREAWRVLGYDSFKAYVDAELHISEQRAYQLVDLGKVVDALQRGLTKAGYNVDMLELTPPPRASWPSRSSTSTRSRKPRCSQLKSLATARCRATPSSRPSARSPARTRGPGGRAAADTQAARRGQLHAAHGGPSEGSQPGRQPGAGHRPA